MILTISLRTVFQADVEGESGVVFEEFAREGVPPDVVAVLNVTDKWRKD